MKAYSKILVSILVFGLVCQTVFGQTKKSANSVFVDAQIKPKFSEMVDYGIPTNKEGVHEFPGGKAPVSNQINPDGSMRLNKTGEIMVPAENIRTTEKSTDINSGSGNKVRNKRKD